jgi:hypothetical protein
VAKDEKEVQDWAVRPSGASGLRLPVFHHIQVIMAQVPTTILSTIAAAFNHLKDDVHTALLTQLGDAAQLQQRIQACSRLMLQISQVGFYSNFGQILIHFLAHKHYSSRSVYHYSRKH